MSSITPVPGQEYFWPNESEMIETIAQISEDLIEKDAQQVAQREQHPKQHGCLWAEFKVEADIPDFLKVGLFQTPTTYPAWVRISSLRQHDDRKGDAYGLALKLMNVPGEKVLEAEKTATTHDLLFTDHPVFLIRNVVDYVDFFNARHTAHGKKPPLKFLFPTWNPAQWRWQEAKTLFFTLGLMKALQKIASPLAIRYWSMTPYQLGDKVIKFRVIPAPSNTVPKPTPLTRDYFQESMAAFLQGQAAEFDFWVQVQSDPQRMPIEDPTVEWKDSPEYKLATIRIPPQIFTSAAQQTFGEHLSFTPWHCLPEHRPLGSINRVRREVYIRTSRRRHQLNQAVNQEPTPETFVPQLISSR